MTHPPRIGRHGRSFPGPRGFAGPLGSAPRLTTLCAALVVGFTLLPGCGGGGERQADVEAGLKVRYQALGAKVRGMDPMDVGDVLGAGITSNIYEPLYQYHYLKRPYEIVPCLAAAMPEVSDDGLTVTIKVRDDVVFQDDECFPGGKGRPVVAEDFIYSWKRLADIKNVSKNWWVLDGRIAGLNAFREYTQGVERKQDVDYDRAVSGLEAVDDHTLRITLTKPWPQIRYYLAYLPTSVVPREAVERYGDEFLNHPVGTGPYVLDEWQRGSRIVLTRNPTFRDERYPSEGEPGDEEAGLLEDAGKQLPFIDKQVFTIIEEDQPAWLKLMNGDVDVGGIPKDNYGGSITPQRELTDELKAKGLELYIYDRPVTFWYGFNMEAPELRDNLPLRRALNLALNRVEYLDLFLNGRGIPAPKIVPPPPLFEAYDEPIDSPYTSFDLDRAKQYVEEAKQAAGGELPELVLSLGGTDTTQRQVGEYLTRLYKTELGLDFRVDFMDWPTLQEKTKTKQVQMFGMGWEADIPDPENFFALFYGPNKSPGNNNMNYQDDAFDALYERLKVMEPGPERTALARQMEQIIVDDLPCVFIAHTTSFRLQYKWCENYKPNVYGYGLMKYQDLDAEMRREMLGR